MLFRLCLLALACVLSPIVLAQEESVPSEISEAESKQVIDRIVDGFAKNKNAFTQGRIVHHWRYGEFENLAEYRAEEWKGDGLNRDFERAVQGDMFLIKSPDENGCEAGVIGVAGYAIDVDGNQKAIVHSDKLNPIDRKSKQVHLFTLSFGDTLAEELLEKEFVDTHPELVKYVGAEDLDGQSYLVLECIDEKKQKKIVFWIDESRGYLPFQTHWYDLDTNLLGFERHIREVRQVGDAFYPMVVTRCRSSYSPDGKLRLSPLKSEVTVFDLETKLTINDLSLDVYYPTVFMDGVHKSARSYFFHGEGNEDGTGCHRLYPDDAEKLFNELQEIRKSHDKFNAEQAVKEAGIILESNESVSVNSTTDSEEEEHPSQENSPFNPVYYVGILLAIGIIFRLVWKPKGR